MDNHRRQFLKFLAASPLLSWQAKQQEAFVLADPKDAINVLEFEEAARRALPPAHFGYMATGVDDDATLRANSEAYKRIQLRPRRMIDVTRTNLGLELFGTPWDWPVFICPCGYQRAFHPDGELATARAAKAKKTVQILSTVTSAPIEQVNDALGKPVWFQLYATQKWEASEKLVKRAEASGSPVLVLTVDLPGGRNTETQRRLRRLDTRQCTACHATMQGTGGMLGKKAMFEGIDATGLTTANSAMTWDFIGKLRGITKMKLVIKGIETREDADLSCKYGVDAILVSNHGGRAEEGGRGRIECLPEVVDGGHGRVPVLVDGGFRRGTDIFKALAMGATAVGIGRPYLWGLSAFGQPGVERVLDILRTELTLVMKQCGARSISEISRSMVQVVGS